MRAFGRIVLAALGALAAVGLVAPLVALAGAGGGTNPDFVVNLPGNGGEFWLRQNDSSWVPLNSVEGPVSFVVGDLDGTPPDDIMGSWGGSINGLFVLLNGSGTYTQFSNDTANNLTTAQLDGDAPLEVVMTFSGVSAAIDGIWVRDNAADTWTKISNLVPDAITASNLDGTGIDELLISFTDGDPAVNGTYAFDFGGFTFTKVSNFAATLLSGRGNLNDDAQGREDAIFIFDPSDITGTWGWVDNGGFQLLANATATTVTSADLDGAAGDELVASFAGLGGTFYTNLIGTPWTQFSNSVASIMAGGDVDGAGNDDLIMSFVSSSPAGTWTWRNNAMFMLETGSDTNGIGIGEVTND